MVEKNKPSLRYEEFTDAWEQRKLGDLVIDVSRPLKMVDDDIYQLVTVKRRNGGIVSRGVYKGSEVLVKSQFIIRTGDYLISKRQVVHGANGIVPEYLDGSIVSNEYLVLHGNKDLNIEFFSLISELPSMYKNYFLSSYGVDIEKLVFNVPDWKRRRISIPSISEQNKITSFINVVNNTIALHHRKYEKLKQIKKALLIQMFPQNGTDEPELRLNGFEEAWEQRKLGDCFRERNERTSEGELISVTINSGVVKASSLKRKDSSSEDKSKYKKVEVGDIAYNSMRMWQGASGVSNYTGIVSPAYTVIIPNSGICSLFFSYQFKRTEMIRAFQINSQGLTSDTWNLKFPLLKDIKVLVPTYEEQIKIGSFFKQLDDTIALQHRKYEKLKQIKKALLQVLFV
ncbi:MULTISPECIES: restriction endonuclease subunit S [Bacillus]|uniref:restriction endonuclease subunit S n=1 Tax=Bacillus TaxID=1386 RepID=UPI000BEDE5D0|nr:MULTISPECIES: restriction endonuclease subunit S [Bacillus]KAB2372580.1 restriction endonuclease subunit S [Bacillus sp. RM2(2019)]PEG02533.1 type I restriction endonuclease subunit S [Bacillus cereus]PGK97800.1 type I restriction endonuclease subunit S [Bacillus cereus]